jgi:hypothetical protein
VTAAPDPVEIIRCKPRTMEYDMRAFALSTILSSALLATAALAAPDSSGHASHAAPAASTGKPTAAATNAALRDLWTEHVFWVRNVVVATLASNAPDADVAEKEVVANARAIAASIEPFYGKAASETLFALLAEHYGAVKKILVATVKPDADGRRAGTTELTDNASRIAKFLAGANPNLPFDTVNALLLAHGAHHLAEIDQLHGHRYAEEAQTWAAMRTHMHVIADALAGAIVKQFPDRFA